MDFGRELAADAAGGVSIRPADLVGAHEAGIGSAIPMVAPSEAKSSALPLSSKLWSSLSDVSIELRDVMQQADRLPQAPAGLDLSDPWTSVMRNAEFSRELAVFQQRHNSAFMVFQSVVAMGQSVQHSTQTLFQDK